jgi:hypothetical protein
MPSKSAELRLLGVRLPLPSPRFKPAPEAGFNHIQPLPIQPMILARKWPCDLDQNENLEAALGISRTGATFIEEMRSLAQDLGAYLYMPGIHALTELLDNKDEMVRYNAAASLASNFIYRPATARLLTMLTSDPDEDCRSMAAWQGAEPRSTTTGFHPYPLLFAISMRLPAANRRRFCSDYFPVSQSL